MNQNQLPHIDIIIVNYNGIEYLPVCLEALCASEYPDFSVIIVDNNSTDKSVDWIKTNYPDVMVIQNRVNEGFGKANQQGIMHSNSPFFALLNSDTKVDPKWLLPLARTIRDEPLCAAVCSKLLFMNYPEVINAAGGGMNFVGYGYDHDIFSVAAVASSEIKDVFFPTAAACLVRRSAFDHIDGFDDSFFMYHEDVDLGWRFHLMGYSVKYIPDSAVYHAFGGTSLKSGSMHFRNRLGLRHALRSLLKNYEIETLKRVLPVFFQLSIRNFMAGIPTGFFRALFWNFLMMPDTIIKRSRVQRQRKLTDKEISWLIWQDVYLPAYFPDYRINTIDTFTQNHINNNHTDIDLIDNKNCNLGFGWHSCETCSDGSHTLFRWTREGAQFFFWNSDQDSILTLKVLGLSDLLGMKREVIVELTYPSKDNPDEDRYQPENIKEHCKRTRHHFNICSDQWEYIEIPLSGSPGTVEVQIFPSSTWSPHKKFNNSDYRRLGIGVASAIIHKI